MGSDFLARKAAKKSRRSDEIKPRRERKKSGPRRLCKGACYSSSPGLTEEDLEQSAPAQRRAPAAAVGELSQYAGLVFNDGNPGRAAPKSDSKRKPGRQQPPAGAVAAEAEAGAEPAGRSNKRPRLSTAVSLLDARTAKAAAPRRATKPSDGAVPVAFAQYPPAMQRFLAAEGYTDALPVQQRCWPALLGGRDVQAVAEPGSGKTLGYLLPAAELLARRGHAGASRPAGPLVLVLAPTRELAQQVAGVCKGLRRHCGGLRTVCLTGGVEKESQVEALGAAPHLLVATPGRLLDLLDRGHLTLDKVRYVVLDEADKMLGLGFAPQVDRLKELLIPGTAAAGNAADAAEEGGAGPAPQKRSARRRPLVGLFTATMPRSVADVADAWLHNPERIAVSTDETAAAAAAGPSGGRGAAGSISRSVTQVAQVCAEHKKMAKLMRHLQAVRQGAKGQRAQPRVLIFSNRIKTVRYLHKEIAAAGFRAALLHGDRSQEERDAAVADFRSGKAQVLVASDVAARGLDIRALPYVVNYDFPPSLDTYVHRVGRTGRLAADGHAFSFLTRELAPLAAPLVALLQAHGQAVDPNLVKLAEAYAVVTEKLGLEGRKQRGEGGDGDGEGAGGGESDGSDGAGGLQRMRRPEKNSVLHELGLKSRQQKRRDKVQAARRQRKSGGGQAEAGSGDDGEGSKEEEERGGSRRPPQVAVKAAAAAGTARPLQEFLPAKKFAGARPGYVFKRGGMGTGYYVDRPPLQQMKKAKQRQPAAGAAAAKGRPVGGSASGDAAPAGAKPVPLLPGRAKQLKRRRGAGSSDSEDDGGLPAGTGAELAGGKRARTKQLPGRLRKKLAKERAERD